MLVNLGTPKQDLYTGDEPELYARTFSLPVDGMSMSLADLRRNYFDKLQDQLGEAAFEQVISEAGLVRSKDTYKGTDDLPLRFLVRGDCLFVFAVGERSPGYYRLRLEGAWRMS